MKCFQKILSDRTYAIGWAVIAFSSVAFFLSLLLIVGTTIFYTQSQNLDDAYDNNTITVEGTAEVSSVPDVAQFSFTVRETEETVAIAQEKSAVKINNIMEYLKKSEIDTEKDVKTTNYSVNPKYEWVRSCYESGCPPGENKLIGHEVSQRITIKVRKTDEAGTVLSEIGKREVSNISGLNFVIDDPESLKDEARAEAIANAKGKAEMLAKELGVELDELVSFYENNNGYNPSPVMYQNKSLSMDMVMEERAAIAPSIPTGENVITTSVSLTYTID